METIVARKRIQRKKNNSGMELIVALNAMLKTKLL